MSLITILSPVLLFVILTLAKFSSNRQVSLVVLLLLGITSASCFLIYEGFFQETLLLAPVQLADASFHFSFVVDNSNVFMLLTVSFLLFWIGVYSIFYLKNKATHLYQCYFRNYTFFGIGILGFILSVGWVQSFIFWEWMGLASFYLIGYDRKPDSERSSTLALTLGKFGDLMFLFGILMVVHSLGTDSIRELSQKFDFENKPILAYASVCIGFGVLVKGGQFPFSIWLRRAMKAPTPISALLHSATMVVAGVLFLSRNVFLLGEQLRDVLFYFAFASILVSAVSALWERDIKKILADSTIAHLGIMLLGMAFVEPQTAMEHLYFQAMSKSWLFLLAGYCIWRMKQAHPTKEDSYCSNIYRFKNALNFDVYTYGLTLVGFFFVFLFSTFFDTAETHFLEILGKQNGFFFAFQWLFEILLGTIIVRLFYYILKAKTNKQKPKWYFLLSMTVPILFALNYLFTFHFSIESLLVKLVSILTAFGSIYFIDKKQSAKIGQYRDFVLDGIDKSIRLSNGLISWINRKGLALEEGIVKTYYKISTGVHFLDIRVVNAFFDGIAVGFSEMGTFVYRKYSSKIKVQYILILFVFLLLILILV